VATDVAARGVHVDGVGLVIHVDPPAEHKAYLHRSGRTARAGASGDVVTISLPAQRKDLAELMVKAKISVKPQLVDEKSPEVRALIGQVAEYVKPTLTVNHQKPAGKSTGRNAQRKRALRDGNKGQGQQKRDSRSGPQKQNVTGGSRSRSRQNSR
jgi:superfamily II DNA/RNA helicase